MLVRTRHGKAFATALAVFSVCAIVPCAVSASSARERAAVHAYLTDMYEYTRAITSEAPAVVGAYEATANRLAGECPGVLADAPQQPGIIVGVTERTITARQRGEANRQQRQLSDLRRELDSELKYAEREPLQAAREAFIAKLATLSSGGPTLAQIVRSDTAGGEEAQAPHACADMKAWTASGYLSLSPTSRTIAQKNEAQFAELLKKLGGAPTVEPLSALEGPADKALGRKIEQLARQTANAVGGPISNAQKRLYLAIGLKTRESPKPPPRPATQPTRIGTGRTATGSEYSVWAERSGKGSPASCRLNVEVRENESAPFERVTSEAGPKGCLSASGARSTPTVECDAGRLKIEGQMLAATRSVSLRMSDGKHIVSRAYFASRRSGGPVAFYYQVVRGPSPIPVSLTELDAHGRTLRVVKLPRVVECSKHLVKYLPGGERTLVHGQTPQGPNFTISGARYRLLGHVHSQLTLSVGTEPDGIEDESGEEEGTFELSERHRPLQGYLESKVSTGCWPHEYAILFGLLEKPHDTVLAKVSGTLLALNSIPIPASVHAHGVLVYLASASQPEEIVVRSPSGSVVASEDLHAYATEQRETCEGESEGTGPAPGAFANIGETSTIALSG